MSVRGKLAATGIAFLMSACGNGAPQSASMTPPEASPAAAATETAAASGSAIASASPEATPAATPEERVLAKGEFAEVVTTDLVVRSAPGTGPDSEIYGTIEHIAAYIVDGPVEADGLEWWLVAHEHSDRLGGPPAGWVAAAGADGEVWLAPAQPECPQAPTGEAAWFDPSMWVSCYTGMELTLEGALYGCAAAIAPIWDNACSLYPCPGDAAPASCLDGVDLQSLILHFDSAPAQDNGRISVSGHFDDPNASACSVVGSPLAPLAVFECRTHFVVTSYEFAD